MLLVYRLLIGYDFKCWRPVFLILRLCGAARERMFVVTVAMLVPNIQLADNVYSIRIEKALVI